MAICCEKRDKDKSTQQKTLDSLDYKNEFYSGYAFKEYRWDDKNSPKHGGSNNNNYKSTNGTNSEPISPLHGGSG